MLTKELYKLIAIALAGAILGGVISGYISYKRGYSSGYEIGAKDKESEIQEQISRANEEAQEQIKKKELEITQIAEKAKKEKESLQAHYQKLSQQARSLKSQNSYLKSQVDKKGQVIYVETPIPPTIYTVGYLRLWNDAIRGQNGVSQDRSPSPRGTGGTISDSNSGSSIEERDRPEFEQGDPRTQVELTQPDFLFNHITNQELCQKYVTSFKRLSEAVKSAQMVSETK